VVQYAGPGLSDKPGEGIVLPHGERGKTQEQSPVDTPAHIGETLTVIGLS
jgi:hypothetical protein